MQARTTFPFTSISQAPQLPPKQPVGMETPAPGATTSQSSPMRSCVVRPLGQRTEILWEGITANGSCWACCWQTLPLKSPLLMGGGEGLV